MNELGANEDIITCERGNSLARVTLTLLMKDTQVKYGAEILVQKL